MAVLPEIDRAVHSHGPALLDSRENRRRRGVFGVIVAVGLENPIIIGSKQDRAGVTYLKLTASFSSFLCLFSIAV